MKLSIPLSIAEVAALAGVSYKTMKAHLMRLNEEVHGTLLAPSKGANRKYTVTLAALKKACPDMFASTENLEARVAVLEDGQKEHQTHLNLVARHVGSLTRDVSDLKKRRPTSPNVVPKTA